MRLITLREWNQRQPKPRCMEQVRRWVKKCMIQPPPILDGKEYLVNEYAVKINPEKPTPQPSDLIQRMLNEQKAEPKKRRPST